MLCFICFFWVESSFPDVSEDEWVLGVFSLNTQLGKLQYLTDSPKLFNFGVLFHRPTSLWFAALGGLKCDLPNSTVQPNVGQQV